MSDESKKQVEVWAHRGLHDEETPENSLSSIEKALESGLKRIEIDTWLHEGELVLTHDEPSGKHALLEEAIKLIDGKTEIYLELKHQASAKPALELIQKVYKQHTPTVIFASFDVSALKIIRENSKDARIGLNYRGVDNYFIDTAEELNAEYLAINWKRLLPNYFNLKQARSVLKVKFLTYTVNDKLSYFVAKKLKMDGIFTDTPALFS